MENDPRPSVAGGLLVALGVIAGAGIGALNGEATPGALIGLVAGIALALLVWWFDR